MTTQKKAIKLSDGQQIKKEISKLEILTRNTKHDNKEWSNRLLFITLYNLDGTNDQIRVFFPVFNNTLDIHEVGAFYLAGWINHLTKNHLQISRFKIGFGSTDKNGMSHISMEQEYEIPLDAVYVPSWNCGEWTPVTSPANTGKP